jgi:hypothetical protein
LSARLIRHLKRRACGCDPECRSAARAPLPQSLRKREAIARTRLSSLAGCLIRRKSRPRATP